MRRPIWTLIVASCCAALYGCDDDPSNTEETVSDAAADIVDVGSTDAGGDDADEPDLAPPPVTYDNEVATGVFELVGTNPELPPNDLEAFAAMVGDARVVALGETVHRSGGFLAAKARLIRYLVEEQGFRVVGFETEWIAADTVDTYIKSDCTTSARDAVQNGIRATWHDGAITDLVDWLCQRNLANAADPVSFMGFNNFQPWHDVPALHAFVDAEMLADADAIKGNLDLCEGATLSSERAYELSNPPGSVVLLADRDACYAGIDAVEAYIAANEADLIARLGEEEVELVSLHAETLRGWEAYRWGRAPEGLNFPEPDALEATRSGIARRDLAMARIFETLVNRRYPEARVVISAHSGHIAKGNSGFETVHPEMFAALEYNENTPRVGDHLDASMGADYAPIHLSAYRASFLDQFLPIDPGAIPGYEPGPAIVENLLHDLPSNALYVDFERAASGDAPFLTAGDAYRFMLPVPLDQWYPVVFEGVPISMFRGMVFLDESGLSRPL